MNWKKGIAYFGLLLITLTMIIAFMLKRNLDKMYGAHTKLVDTEQFQPKTGTVLIKNGNVLSEDGLRFLEGHTVLLENGVITAIDSTVSIPIDATIIDATGKFLIPGLIESHAHLFKSRNDLLLYIANGVTEIREMIGSKEQLVLKKQIENGRIGPKMWVASPPLGTASDMQSRFISWTRRAINLADAEEATETIKELYEQGYDGIKIYSHLNKESYLAATKTANELDLPIVGHIPWSVEVEDIWQNGQSEIAHLEEIMNTLRRQYGRIEMGEGDKFLDFITEKSELIADNLIKNDIAVTSTLSLVESFVRQKFELDKVLSEIPLAYVNSSSLEGIKFGDSGFGWLPETNIYRIPKGLPQDEKMGRKAFWTIYAQACQVLAKELSQKGVKILVGTDTNVPPMVPGFSLHKEMESLQRQGMTNAQVLQAATAYPSEFMNSNAGKIMEGYEANLVLLDKNPLIDIRLSLIHI